MKEIFSQTYAGTVNKVLSLDNPGPGGACHKYLSVVMPADATSADDELQVEINFQKGPVKEVGVNGIQGEHLLAMLIDRLEGFQEGPYACKENAGALASLKEAMEWMNARTADRTNRKVEGLNKA